jgi:hypothetical protein
MFESNLVVYSRLQRHHELLKEVERERLVKEARQQRSKQRSLRQRLGRQLVRFGSRLVNEPEVA